MYDCCRLYKYTHKFISQQKSPCGKNLFLGSVILNGSLRQHFVVWYYWKVYYGFSIESFAEVNLVFAMSKHTKILNWMKIIAEWLTGEPGYRVSAWPERSDLKGQDQFLTIQNSDLNNSCEHPKKNCLE